MIRALVIGTEHRVAAAVAAEFRASGFDVSDQSSAPASRDQSAAAVIADVSRMGGLDALVVASWTKAAASPRRIDDIDDDCFGQIWEQGVLGLLWALQAAIPALRDSGGSVVVLLPTIALTGGSHYAAASAMFEAQRVMVKAAARQLGPDRIRVNAVTIAPELVLDDAPASDVHYLAPAAISEDQQPGDVASLVRFLVGPDGQHLTGQSIAVDGGRWLAP